MSIVNESKAGKLSEKLFMYSTVEGSSDGSLTLPAYLLKKFTENGKKVRSNLVNLVDLMSMNSLYEAYFNVATSKCGSSITGNFLEA
ncbi:hypothetical protein WICPIJ_000257 [Wickerhamomyces pijperi]|uniref:Uncharacterized protein n=1 Tax=Wickerhamomyces pijperi TaxID=599730 RepID=A0A9P8QH78_WICPI|nr:hypothetical protein WICPIJ_000257 [Wickerhamomyces pijperi]